MSFLDATTPAAEELAAGQVKTAIRELTNHAIDAVKQIQTQIWLTDVDPQDVFDEFTTNAEKILLARDGAVAFLQVIADETGQTLTDLIAPGWYEPIDGKDLTINVDGTVTVIDV